MIKMTEFGDISKFCSQLEEQEIEAAGGIASPHVYGQLLTVYLLQNDTINAKFLWKRIPQPIKTANNELGLIWTVGQKLWQREYPNAYESLQKEWPDYLKPLIAQLTEAIRGRALNLVALAYSSITTEQLASVMGVPAAEAVEHVATLGWHVDSQTKMITPKKPSRPVDMVLPSEKQLARLTDCVSFLEN